MVCAGAVIDTFCEVLTVNVLVIVSKVAVAWLMDALTTIIGGALLTNIDVDVLMDVNVNVFAGLVTAFGFAMPGPLEEFRC